jgi:hypothetical protein
VRASPPPRPVFSAVASPSPPPAVVSAVARRSLPQPVLCARRAHFRRPSRPPSLRPSRAPPPPVPTAAATPSAPRKGATNPPHPRRPLPAVCCGHRPLFWVYGCSVSALCCSVTCAFATCLLLGAVRLLCSGLCGFAL